MEVDGMKEIFQRSVPQRNAKYIKYIGDGDTKTFPELQRTAPYSIEKVECVGHIQKRMCARLRKLKTMNRGKKLSDGKSISGKNRLTDKFIDTITTYYGNAIRQNNSSISDMRQALWAIYCHYRSTDEEPMHHFCPIGDTSWCKYQKAVATNSVSLFKHKNIVPIAVMDEIKPIIAELSAPKLLKKKCVGPASFNRHQRYTYSTAVRRRHSENCFPTVPFAVPIPTSTLCSFSARQCRAHTVHVAMNCFTACQTLPCLSRLPDLSPIELVWDMMGRRPHLSGPVDDLAC
ncbi:uncharacterized protein TNCV_473451 [Trichonephila clavipes]|nr:uncharacterized protein TNCV_473451 [Trichonephila clavipes]